LKDAKDKFLGCSIKKKALFIRLDISPQNENNFKDRINIMKNFIGEKQYNFPILILPFSWCGKFKPILNKTAGKSIFYQICQ